MTQPIHLMVFTLDEQLYALSITGVERVIRAVEITPMPKMPDIVLGVINNQGQLVPVINIRKRFQLPTREIVPSNHFILARTSRRSVALVVDTILNVLECQMEEIVAVDTILPVAEYIQGIAKLHEGMIFIHDLDTFLSLDEEQAIQQATG
ncbi:MAG: purine-binding chemotaxis protein CheW [Acidobacteria bacterium]|nr:purine-binding chemotaxis protein CheW [Acidobacteriota bacterium]